ncbi:MAG: DMT family transporter [Clostridia bacterium]|nr:DMT family transporter [Clostridia bacterium]
MQSKNATVTAVLCAVLGNIIWGFGFLFTKISLDVAPDPNVMLGHRFTLSTLFMLVPILLGKQKISFKGKKWGPISLLLLLQITYYLFESFAILHTNSTISGLVLAIVPVVTIGTGALFLKEYPSKWQILFCIMPVIGVILITISGKELGVVTPVGVLFLILTLLSSALYKTVNRKASEEFTPYERTFMVLAISAIVFNISGMSAVKWDITSYVAPLIQPRYALSVLCLSLFSSILANILVNYALSKMSVFKVSSFGALSTLCSAVAGIVFLKEPFSISLVIGGILILVGVNLITSFQPKNRAKKAKLTQNNDNLIE